MTRRRLGLMLAVALGGLAFTGLGVLADDKRDKRRKSQSYEAEVQQDEVLEAITRNEIRPLPEILAVAQKALPGPVVRIKVKRADGRLVYEVRVIAEQGRVREVYIDAATLAIVKIE